MPAIPAQPYAINYVSEDNASNNQIFVQNLYSNILGRQADQGGLDYWTNLLNSHLLSRAQVIHDFFDSSELQNQFQATTDPVQSVFHSLMLRDATAADQNNWSSKISSGSLSLGDIAKSLLNTLEFQTIQNTKTTLPTVNVLWEDRPSWDSITATQLAKLIAYSPDAGKTYPNANLEFVVSGFGPNSTATLAPPSHIWSSTNQIYKNTADDLSNFIKSISDQVSTLSDGQVKWGVSGGTGSVAYHPDMSIYSVNDWSGWAPAGSTASADQYKTLIDYSLYLSHNLSSKGLQGFSQVVFETEDSNYDNKHTINIGKPPLFGQNGQQNGDLFQYKGDPSLLSQYGISSWRDVFKATATSGPTENWNPQTFGFASDKYLAQAYDLAATNAEFNPQWGGNPSFFDPTKVSPSQAALAFVNFFASQGDKKFTNVKDLIAAPEDSTFGIGTSFNPNASFIFSYGMVDGHDPQFQNTTYTGSSGASGTADGYRWSANDFANFLSGSGNQTGFISQLIQNLQNNASALGAKGSFADVSDLSVGVWGGERALDAWIGF